MLFKAEDSKRASQCSDVVEIKQSLSPTGTLKPVVRACESCRARKVRCLPEDPTTCQRCARSGRDCIYTAPEKRRRRKRTDTRVAELEHMVQMLAAKLEEEQRAREVHTQSDVLVRRPSQTASINGSSPANKEALHHQPARPPQEIANPTSLISVQRQPSYSSNSTASGLPSVIGSPVGMSMNLEPASSDAKAQAFGPTPSPDYIRRSTLPPSLQVGPWPTPNASLSPANTNWHEAPYSPHPSPSQSVSLASTASPQTESWPSPALEPDYTSIFPDMYTNAVDDKTNLALMDPSMWWMDPNFAPADQPEYFQNVQSIEYSKSVQPQSWGFPCTEI
ncbi:MAG: hypothetical protein L6R39_005657 [Caloplaca ligustica]|nr:MAG: hypothetical protein L6R39_005657 [Caloplaca ligustica]